MGITFKENVADIRNTKVVDLIRELEGYSLQVDVTDPYADAGEVQRKFGIRLQSELSTSYDAIVIAVGHEAYRNESDTAIARALMRASVIFDLKDIRCSHAEGALYWKL
jgi:UDP-N-acetyl-D-galactosamine dehydrogenase